MQAPLLTHKYKNYGNSNWRSFSFFLVVGIFFITWVQTSRGNIFSKEHPIGVTTTTSQPVINPSSFVQPIIINKPVTQKIAKAKDKLNLKMKTKGPELWIPSLEVKEKNRVLTPHVDYSEKPFVPISLGRDKSNAIPFVPGNPITSRTTLEAWTPLTSAPKGEDEIKWDNSGYAHADNAVDLDLGPDSPTPVVTHPESEDEIKWDNSGYANTDNAVDLDLGPDSPTPVVTHPENWKHIRMKPKSEPDGEWDHPMWGNAYDLTVNGHTISRSSAPYYKEGPRVVAHDSLRVDKKVLEFLRRQGIGAVLSFNHQKLLPQEEALFAKFGISYLHILIKDHTAIHPDQLWEGATFYWDNARMGRKVTVWCWYGLGRTGEFMAAWIYEASGRNDRFSSKSQCEEKTKIEQPKQWTAIKAYYYTRLSDGKDTLYPMLYPTKTYLKQIRQYDRRNEESSSPGANQWWEKLESSKKQDIIDFVSQALEQYGGEWGEDVIKDVEAEFPDLTPLQIRVLPTILSTTNKKPAANLVRPRVAPAAPFPAPPRNLSGEGRDEEESPKSHSKNSMIAKNAFEKK